MVDESVFTLKDHVLLCLVVVLREQTIGLDMSFSGSGR